MIIWDMMRETKECFTVLKFRAPFSNSPGKIEIQVQVIHTFVVIATVDFKV